MVRPDLSLFFLSFFFLTRLRLAELKTQAARLSKMQVGRWWEIIRTRLKRASEQKASYAWQSQHHENLKKMSVSQREPMCFLAANLPCVYTWRSRSTR